MQLTEEQHQVIEAARGKPVDVVDPRTNCTYVLLPTELWQRMRNHVDITEEPEQNSACEAPKFPLPAEGQPMRVKLRELPTPPEVAEEVKKNCRGWFWRRKDVREVEEELKLQYYFGGHAVSYFGTKEGLVIVAAGVRDSDAYDQLLSFLTPEERSRTVLDFPCRWHETTSEVLTPFSDEG